MMGLQVELAEASELMKQNCSSNAGVLIVLKQHCFFANTQKSRHIVASASELFSRFVTRTSLDTPVKLPYTILYSNCC
jgi:hypothetical protein